jgi:hypothetical protein
MSDNLEAVPLVKSKQLHALDQVGSLPETVFRRCFAIAHPSYRFSAASARL